MGIWSLFSDKANVKIAVSMSNVHFIAYDDNPNRYIGIATIADI